MRAIYTIGTRIGNLTVTHKEGRKYYVACSCGAELVFGSREMKIKTKDLKKKGFAGCGKCSWNYYRENRTDVEKYRYIFNAYKKSASVRKIKFKLSREEFTEMIKFPCFYCGKVNSNSRKDRLTNDLIYYNGVDRLDSNLHYNSNNTVSCCSTCNYMKGTLSVPEFLAQISLVYNKNVQRPSREGVDSSESKKEISNKQELENDMV